MRSMLEKCILYLFLHRNHERNIILVLWQIKSACVGLSHKLFRRSRTCASFCTCVCVCLGAREEYALARLTSARLEPLPRKVVEGDPPYSDHQHAQSAKAYVWTHHGHHPGSTLHDYFCMHVSQCMSVSVRKAYCLIILDTYKSTSRQHTPCQKINLAVSWI